MRRSNAITKYYRRYPTCNLRAALSVRAFFSSHDLLSARVE